MGSGESASEMARFKRKSYLEEQDDVLERDIRDVLPYTTVRYGWVHQRRVFQRKRVGL
jgi:hypothetical protein